jgi:hypothetical protein
VKKNNLFYNLKEPSRVYSLSYKPTSFGQVNLNWFPPRQPNGIIEFYFIAYTKLNDLEQFSYEADSCQFSNYYYIFNETNNN